MKFHNLFLVVILLTFSCSEKPAEIQDQPDVTAIENGLIPGIVIKGSELPAWTISERMAHYRVPGVSIAFFENNEIQWTRTYGFLDSGRTQAVDENTRFQAASISKPVAASGMMKLIESGDLDLDADVNTYLTGWKLPENPYDPNEHVTLRRLVTHNAGLTVHGFRGYASDEPVPGTMEILLGETPANSDAILPDTIPGAIWRYSGGGYTLMQYVIETNFNSSFSAFMKENVLDPAGMERSIYQQPLPEDMHQNTSVGHRPDGQPVTGKWHTYPEMAAAGLWTTPSDLGRWAMAVQRAYNGSETEFIQPETAKMILTKHINDWGLGPGLGGEGDSLYFRHGGANEGYRCMLFSFAGPGGQGMAIMTNGDLGGPLMNEIARSVDAAYGWNVYLPDVRTVIDMSTADLNSYAGTYVAEERGIEVEILMEGELLKGKVGTNVFTLYPEDTDRFFDDQDGQSIFFERNDENIITGFSVDGLQFVRL
ncbi:serine hydrolase domain-containing protein [Fulvivirga sedimenti]|uniref:Beta-lactamase family protein n=1 Tax=Fulvivirga sedimenti TaxID=2879465 RepID=A0A9X1HSU8_9BACT|nr:serine hydrolase domain-containing protein [Fulvivirga sedimenti]MCA6075562.1 beta-lactamase family protein [Fulvivirga sedimenti]MCA6076739.1 beta-lactamase family protein [Fulvivirga sedimenti]MCA6077867.1 beta-lactamase family protein [Fulvivirga sedimenti]